MHACEISWERFNCQEINLIEMLHRDQYTYPTLYSIKVEQQLVLLSREIALQILISSDY